MQATQAHYVSDKRAAEFLGISVASVRRWRIARLGPPYVKLGSTVRYSLEELKRWAESKAQRSEKEVQ